MAEEKKLPHEVILDQLEENFEVMASGRVNAASELAHKLSGGRSALTVVLCRMEMSEEHLAFAKDKLAKLAEIFSSLPGAPEFLEKAIKTLND